MLIHINVSPLFLMPSMGLLALCVTTEMGEVDFHTEEKKGKKRVGYGWSESLGGLQRE